MPTRWSENCLLRFEEKRWFTKCIPWMVRMEGGICLSRGRCEGPQLPPWPEGSWLGTMGKLAWVSVPLQSMGLNHGISVGYLICNWRSSSGDSSCQRNLRGQNLTQLPLPAPPVPFPTLKVCNTLKKVSLNASSFYGAWSIGDVHWTICFNST